MFDDALKIMEEEAHRNGTNQKFMIDQTFQKLWRSGKQESITNGLNR